MESCPGSKVEMNGYLATSLVTFVFSSIKWGGYSLLTSELYKIKIKRNAKPLLKLTYLRHRHGSHPQLKRKGKSIALALRFTVGLTLHVS